MSDEEPNKEDGEGRRGRILLCYYGHGNEKEGARALAGEHGEKRERLEQREKNRKMEGEAGKRGVVRAYWRRSPVTQLVARTGAG